MKPGDLIRFNSAGQRNKTLGLILDQHEKIALLQWDEPYIIILIQWCLVGDFMPRKDFKPGESWNYDKPKPGEFYWYKKADWFEVVS